MFVRGSGFIWYALRAKESKCQDEFSALIHYLMISHAPSPCLVTPSLRAPSSSCVHTGEVSRGDRIHNALLCTAATCTCKIYPILRQTYSVPL
jgi:hypothetical protein